MDPINQSVPQQPNIAPINNTPIYNKQTNMNPSNIAPKKVGPIVTALVVVLILVIAALYLLASRIDKQTTPVIDTTSAINTPTVNESQTAAVTSTTVTPVTNTADDLQSLQSDLNTSTQGVDSQSF